METQPLRDPRDGAASDSSSTPPYHSTDTAAASPATAAAAASATATATASSASAPTGGGQKKSMTWDEDSRFMCNICLDPVTQTVCTLCGHLYCWPCLYRWLNTGHSSCPVCKAGVTRENVIPIFVRGDDTDPRTGRAPGSAAAGGGSSAASAVGGAGAEGDVPSRPSAQRPPAPPPMAGHANGFGFGGLHNVQFSAGVGFFPSLFGLQFQSFAMNAPQADPNRPLTPEEIAQINTSRFLMTLGFFVVFCLLFF